MIDWTQLTVAIAALLVLFYVVYWNARQQEKRDAWRAEWDVEQARRYEALLEKYAGVTSSVIGVIRENTEAMVEGRVGSNAVRDAVESIRELFVQIDDRLRNGDRKFDEHSLRLDKLEHEG